MRDNFGFTIVFHFRGLAEENQLAPYGNCVMPSISVWIETSLNQGHSGAGPGLAGISP